MTSKQMKFDIAAQAEFKKGVAGIYLRRPFFVKQLDW